MKNPELTPIESENTQNEVNLNHATLHTLIEYSKALENTDLDEVMQNQLKEQIVSLINTHSSAIQPTNGFVRVKAWDPGQGSKTYDIGFTKETLGIIKFVAANSRE